MAGDALSDVVTDDPKYMRSNRTVQRRVMRFFDRVGQAIDGLDFDNALDVGCGEGVLLHCTAQRFTGKRVVGIDIDPADIAKARRNAPFADTFVADATALPFADRAFDLVMSCEMLEHLEEPAPALAEIARVTRKVCLLTVPDGPLWRLGNLMRLEYLGTWGRFPAHLNEWGRWRFARFVRTQFEIIGPVNSFPWIGLICRPKACQAARQRSHGR